MYQADSSAVVAHFAEHESGASPGEPHYVRPTTEPVPSKISSLSRICTVLCGTFLRPIYAMLLIMLGKPAFYSGCLVFSRFFVLYLNHFTNSNPQSQLWLLSGSFAWAIEGVTDCPRHLSVLCSYTAISNSGDARAKRGQ